MTQPQTHAPGWYIDPRNDEAERYWNGSAFAPGSRTLSPGTLPLPVGTKPAAPTEGEWRALMLSHTVRQADAAERTASYAAALFWLWLVASVAGVALTAWAVRR